MAPWYRGFRGTIAEVPAKAGGKSYNVSGVVTQVCRWLVDDLLCVGREMDWGEMGGRRERAVGLPVRAVLGALSPLLLPPLIHTNTTYNTNTTPTQHNTSNNIATTPTNNAQQTGDHSVDITELPVRKWTQDYKEYLEALLKGDGSKAGAGGKDGDGGDGAKKGAKGARWREEGALGQGRRRRSRCACCCLEAGADGARRPGKQSCWLCGTQASSPPSLLHPPIRHTHTHGRACGGSGRRRGRRRRRRRRRGPDPGGLQGAPHRRDGALRLRRDPGQDGVAARGGAREQAQAHDQDLDGCARCLWGGCCSCCALWFAVIFCNSCAVALLLHTIETPTNQPTHQPIHIQPTKAT